MHDEFVLDLYQFYALFSIHSFEYCIFPAVSKKCVVLVTDPRVSLSALTFDFELLWCHLFTATCTA